METYSQLIQTISLAMGASWASGINLYATLLVLGLGAASGSIVLPEGLAVLGNPMVIGAAGLMYLVEFVADKTPGVDTGWDAIHTFVRIPAGALLAAGAVGDVAPAMEIAAAILGGTMAASTHATKAGGRVIINTSPEPFSNWVASISEDVLVFAGMWAAINHPVFFTIVLVFFVLLMIWVLPKVWNGVKKVFGFIGRLVGRGSDPVSENVGPGSGKDVMSDQEKLAELQGRLESGAIEQAEYEAAKSKIMDTQ